MNVSKYLDYILRRLKRPSRGYHICHSKTINPTIDEGPTYQSHFYSPFFFIGLSKKVKPRGIHISVEY